MTTTPKLLLTVLVLFCVFAVTPSPANAAPQIPPLPDSAILWRTPIAGDPLDGSPRDIAVDETTGRVYVPSVTENVVAVVDDKGRIVDTFDLPTRNRYPLVQLIVDPGHSRLFLTDPNGDVSILDDETYELISRKEFPGAGVLTLVLDSPRDRLVAYTLSASKPFVVLDPDTLAELDGFSSPFIESLDLTLNPATGDVFVHNQPQSLIHQVDVDTGQTRLFASGFVDGPSSLAIDPRRNRMYAPAGWVGLMYVIDMDSASTVATLETPTPFDPFSVRLAEDFSVDRIYLIANTTLASIDTATNRVRSTWALADEPRAMAFDASRQHLYVLTGADLIAIDATQFDNPAQFPMIGGPPTAPGANSSRWLTFGALLTVLGLLLAQRAMRKQA